MLAAALVALVVLFGAAIAAAGLLGSSAEEPGSTPTGDATSAPARTPGPTATPEPSTGPDPDADRDRRAGPGSRARARAGGARAADRAGPDAPRHCLPHATHGARPRGRARLRALGPGRHVLGVRAGGPGVLFSPRAAGPRFVVAP